MDRITASPETLMKQAGYTAEVWLMQALESIDKTFGDGFAKKNPELVSGFMKAASTDLLSSTLGSVLQDSSEQLVNILRDIVERLDTRD